MIKGNKAPPTMDMITREDPSLVSSPNDFTLKEKIVGNMMDMKNSTPTRA
jgi:hypothetical protein